MNFSSKVFGAVLAVTVSAPLAYAEQKSGVQTRASGPGIYRIELRNVGRFLMHADGDPESEGEINSLSISLLEPKRTRDRQSNTVVEAAPMLVNTSTGARAGSGYVPVNSGEIMQLGERRSARSDYNLWIHSAYRNQPEDGNFLRFTLVITVKELDCSLQKVCRRGNIGSKVFDIKVPPLRAVPPRDCRAENTFIWTTVDGQEVIQDNGNLTGRIQKDLSYKDDRDFAGFDTTSIGPFVSMMNAEICVARTW